jgi:hypothetical protein
MQWRKWTRLAATVQIAVLAGCVPAVMAPTVTATPGPGKLPADFAADNTACATQANQQMAPVVQAANNQVLQNALSQGGQDPLTGSAQASQAVQQQYDNAYSACMYGKGDNVPPYYMQPAYYAEPTEEPTYRTKKRVVRKHTPPPAATASASLPNSGFVVPAASSATAGGSGFVTPAPTVTASGSAAAPSSTSFAVPPPAH